MTESEPPPLLVVVLAAGTGLAVAMHALRNTAFLWQHWDAVWPGSNKGLFGVFVVFEVVGAGLFAWSAWRLSRQRPGP